MVTSLNSVKKWDERSTLSFSVVGKISTVDPTSDDDGNDDGDDDEGDDDEGDDNNDDDDNDDDDDDDA